MRSYLNAGVILNEFCVRSEEETATYPVTRVVVFGATDCTSNATVRDTFRCMLECFTVTR